MLTASEFLENTKAFFILLFQLCVVWPIEVIKSLLPRKRKDISGDIMFMTGAGSGLGRSMSIKFAEYGATLICTDINEESAKETAEMIKESGGKAHSFKLDVTDRHAVYKLANQIKDEIGDVTMLVNNAGIVTGRKFMDCPDEKMLKTMEVNTISHFWTLKAFLGPMIQKNSGHIISIASIAGYAGGPAMVDYCASKFGAVGLTEALMVELKYEAPNVMVTSICPWFIKTGMFDGARSFTKMLPMMETDYVVKEVVASVLNNEKTVFIPKRLMALTVFKSIAPNNIGLKAADYLRLDEQMKNFTGRNAKKSD